MHTSKGDDSNVSLLPPCSQQRNTCRPNIFSHPPTNKRTNEQTNKRTSKRTNERTNKRTNKQKNIQPNERTNEQRTERTNERTPKVLSSEDRRQELRVRTAWAVKSCLLNLNWWMLNTRSAPRSCSRLVVQHPVHTMIRCLEDLFIASSLR